MGRKKKAIPVGTIAGIDVTRAHMPQFHPACRCGVHGDAHYNRRRDKAALRRHLAEEGAGAR